MKLIRRKSKSDDSELRASRSAGLIALVFLVVGYQAALFVHKAAEAKIVSNRDEPDTVFVYLNGEATGERGRTEVRHDAAHAPASQRVRAAAPHTRVETFRFNPNTVSVEDLQRLGFSLKQAQSIDNYRQKGGRFRRKSDFAKSFVVADSVYKRLEPYIDIPLVDLNKADSAAFDSLPGVGGWFARKMVDYREQLGGYSCKEQLMEIYHFDKEKFDGLKDLVTVSETAPFRLWSLPADSLVLHPHVRYMRTAKAIVLYRDNNPKDKLTIEGLYGAGILDEGQRDGLSRCRIADP